MKFSIIVTHYQPSIPHRTFLRGIDSITGQRGFPMDQGEILIYHDGPLTEPYLANDLYADIHCSTHRFNDHGHSLRDIGIREAKGDYLLFFNADNVLYPNALELIAREIDRPARFPMDFNNIVIFPVKMFGMHRLWGQAQREPGADWATIYTGDPPVLYNIDCMQFVMKRELWLRTGWADKTAEGDGRMFEVFAKHFGYRQVGEVLGEHH